MRMNDKPTAEQIKVAQDLLFTPGLAPRPGSVEWWIEANPREFAALKRRHEQAMVQALLDHQAKRAKG
jgi:hypothetical protein